ncbi:MAG: hypothetical protein JO056_08325 [Alphaproteobacteria bacterium]|nr:hypothetical protein [Alphaproteobacteria bacterium]
MRLRALLLIGVCLAASSAAQADFMVSNKPTHDVSCVSGICTPTAANANLNANELTDMLASGDVALSSDGHGTTPNIQIANGFSWASTSRLSLQAAKNIVVKAPVIVAGAGAVAIAYANGDLFFDKTGKIDFWDLKSSLVINSLKFTLVADIKSLANKIAAKPSGRYALAKDYDASVDGTYKDSPVGTTFLGTFEGLGHTVANLTIAVPSSSIPLMGFFTQSAGTLRDIRLSNLLYTKQFFGNSSVAGGLVAENDGVISGASTTGSIPESNDDLAAGGLAGINRGSITASMSAVEIGTGGGGLVDQNYGTISQSFASGSASGVDPGGLAYFNDKDGTITQSYATGNVSSVKTPSGYGNVGGLVAVNWGTVAQTFATGTATGASGKKVTVGGLIGVAVDGLISQSYATGAVVAGKKNTAGGLVGEVDAKVTLTQSYSTGLVSIGQGLLVGGFIGYDKSAGAHMDSAYWDLDTSGIDDTGRGAGAPRNDPGITGLTDAQLKSGLPAGFDPNVWGQSQDINNGYPYLLANPPAK